MDCVEELLGNLTSTIFGLTFWEDARARSAFDECSRIEMP
jgi:hypothetical protein